MKIGWAIAALALGAPLAASAADLSGAWTVKGDFGPKLKYTLVCLLKGNGTKFSGPCVATLGPMLKATGRLAGATMRFGYDTEYNYSGLHLDYVGNLQEDGVVRGVIDTRLSTGAFQATPLMQDGAGQASAWKVEVAFDALKYVVLCAFKSNSGNLRGPCAVTQGPTLQASGVSDGVNVTLGYDTDFQGQPVHVEYKGVLQPDGSLKGTTASGSGVGVFTATRQ